MCEECEACPFNIYSEQSQYANNLGCLPDYQDIVEDFEKDKKVWACHERPDKACNGFINYFKKNKSDIKYKEMIKSIENNKLRHDWSVHGKKYDFIGFLKSYIKKGSVVDLNEKNTVVVISANNFNNIYFLTNNGTVIVDSIENISYFYFSNDEKYIQLKELRKEAKNISRN